MAGKFNVFNELVRAQLENLSSDPTPTSTGLHYFNTTSGFAKIYNGSSWVSIVDDSTAQTLTNKTLGSGTVLSAGFLLDSGTTFRDNVDNTKLMQFELSGISTATTRTLTVPNANTTLVGTDATQTLTNKTLSGNIATNLVSGAATITLPTTASTLATLALAETLTNKTLGSGTSITAGSIVDAGVAFADDGDATKLMKFQLSGITTGTTRTLTVPDASTTIVGTDTAQVITAKDIDGGTASNTSRLTVPKAATATLSGLTRKQGTVVYDTTLDKPFYDTGTSLVSFTAGGSGEINMVTTGSNSATDWAVVGTMASVATTTTAGDLPLSPVSTSAIKITSGTGAGEESSDSAYYVMTVPEALKNRKLKVELWTRPGTNFIANEWTVSVYTGSSATSGTRMSLSTDASNPDSPPTQVTFIPNATGKFTTTFNADSTATYTLRIAREINAGSNAAVLNVAGVVVGPGVQPQGAVVGEWQTYSGTFAAASTTTNTGRYRRVGDSMELDYRAVVSSAVTGAVEIPLPTGFTIDTSKTTDTGSGGDTFGIARAFDSSASTYYLGAATGGSASNKISVRGHAGSTWNATAPMTWATGDEVIVRAVVPITEWAGTGTVNLASGDSMGSPFVYTFTSWNPSGTGAVLTDPTAGTVSVSNVDISASSISSGTVTFTFNRQGKYLVSTNVGHQHANTYTASRFDLVHGGTASRYGTLSDTTSVATGIDAQDTDEYESSCVFVVDVTATGQTYTFRPTFNSNGISNTAQHTARAAVVIQPVSTIGQAIGFGDATSTQSGLVNTTTQTFAGQKTFSTGLTGPTSSTATTFTMNGSGGTSSSVTLRYQKIGDWVTLHIPAFSVTSGTNSTQIQANTAIDSAYRPLTVTQSGPIAQVRNNGSSSTSNGIYELTSAGVLTIFRDATGTATFTNASSCGTNSSHTLSYYIGTGS